ncbi:MAG TPA: FkbM family methyltransferase [Verrucomicrobiae bacterium]|nr:FkbM family methyltransferase [Verrucomicrobiae bacterium]
MNSTAAINPGNPGAGNFLKELIRPVVIKDRLIRVGKEADGAYIIPERVLRQCDVCYSYGISDNIDFDRAYHQITGHPVQMYDFSVTAPPNLPAPLIFHQEGLSAAKTANCDNYLVHLRANGDEHKKVLLKIDVEGAEYDWLLQTDLAEVARTAICIVMEFHSLHTQGQIFLQCLEKLKTEYHIVHVHGNNYNGTVPGAPEVPQVPEITFVHKSAADFSGPVAVKYPLAGLDVPNRHGMPQMVIDYRAWIIRAPRRLLVQFKNTLKPILQGS